MKGVRPDLLFHRQGLHSLRHSNLKLQLLVNPHHIQKMLQAPVLPLLCNFQALIPNFWGWLGLSADGDDSEPSAKLHLVYHTYWWQIQ
jgi:hypothetical protein